MFFTEKRGLKFYLKLYRKILIQDLKSKMSYRADFIISNLGMIISNIVGFVTFYILFSNFPSINGWTMYEMLFMYGFSLIALTPLQCFFDNNWNLRMMVKSGDFIKYCFRPVNIFFYFVSEVFDVKGIGQFCFGLGTLIYAWNHLAIPVTFITVAQTVLFLLAMFRFKDYAKYPASIFNTVFRFIFTFVIPIAFIAFYPSLVLLRSDNVPLLSWLSPLIGLIFFFLSCKFWIYGARKYDGTGS